MNQVSAGGSLALTIEAPATIGSGIAAKGSIALDGVSLTVNGVGDRADFTRFTELVLLRALQRIGLVSRALPSSRCSPASPDS